MRATVYRLDPEEAVRLGDIVVVGGKAQATTKAAEFLQPKVLGGNGKWLKPTDGEKYLRALQEQYAHSSGFSVELFDDDGQLITN
jgi:hypothetical protein